MCGIAEFRCRGFVDHPGFLDVAGEFTTYLKPLDHEQVVISIYEYHGHCLCHPTAEEKAQFLKIVTFLERNSKELVYSPNDYSYNSRECFFETCSAEEVVERYWPSLVTPPMRIAVMTDRPLSEIIIND